MGRLYYRIWADAIASAKSSRAEAPGWKAYTLIPISLLMGINLFTFFIWMKKIVDHYLPLFLPVRIFNANLINDAIAIVLTLFAPFLLLNYLLIFLNDRYKTVLPPHKPGEGHLYRNYTLITLGVFIVPLVIEAMFF